jgi:hypothetical protein
MHTSLGTGGIIVLGMRTKARAGVSGDGFDGDGVDDCCDLSLENLVWCEREVVHLRQLVDLAPSNNPGRHSPRT